MKIDEEIIKRGLQFFCFQHYDNKFFDRIILNLKEEQKRHDEYVKLQKNENI